MADADNKTLPPSAAVAPGGSNGGAAVTSADDDPYLWLEEIDGKRAMDWVKAHNAVTVKAVASTPAFRKLQADILEVLDSDARIPMVNRMGEWLYNFWRDKAIIRAACGAGRRSTNTRRDKPDWKNSPRHRRTWPRPKKMNWVYHGADCLKPEYRHCLVNLSRGGADAVVVREFDLTTLSFVKDGFYVPEAKTQATWKTVDELYVGTDFGPGSMTKSSYPRLVKEWKRGALLTTAKLVYEGKADDVSVNGWRDHTPGFERDFVQRGVDFFHSETFLRKKDGTLVKVDVPTDAELGTERQWMTVLVKTPWTVAGKTYAPGTLLAANFDAYMAGKRDLTVLYTPTDTTSLASKTWTKNHLVLNLLDNVVNRIEVLTPPAAGAPANAEWKREPLGGAPELCTSIAFGTDEDRSDEYFLMVTGFLTPTTLARGVLGQGTAAVLKQTLAFFDASLRQVQQRFATSKDGTRVPYFVISPKALKENGKNPTLLYGYGGFEVSLQPHYSGSIGRAWLNKGGVYVVANIRGGGEYGPRWHNAALRENRLRAYEDFAAVAHDLVARKITSQPHLGIQGGSNGGLLMGNMLTQYPQLFSAVVVQVPLLDMKRYTHLSAGASWIGEYGDPDKPEEWKFIQTFSPYQLVKKGAHYPPSLFVTSTRDDRVGPVHARKMAAKMMGLGYDVHFYENIEGGHGAAADNKEMAFMNALQYTFLWDRLK